MLTAERVRDELTMQTLWKLVYRDGPTWREWTVPISDEEMVVALDPRMKVRRLLTRAFLGMGAPPDEIEALLSTQQLGASSPSFAFERLADGASAMSVALRSFGTSAAELTNAIQDLTLCQVPSELSIQYYLDPDQSLQPTNYGEVALFTAPCPGCGQDVTWQSVQGIGDAPDTITIWDEECCG